MSASKAITASISAWAAELGLSRDRLRKELTRHAIAPAGKERRYLAYRAADVFRALAGAEPGFDPAALSPYQRRAWFQSEMEALRLAEKRGELCPLPEVEAEFGRIVKGVAEAYELLPDILERDGGLTPRQLAIVERILDEARERLYERLIEGTEEAES